MDTATKIRAICVLLLLRNERIAVSAYSQSFCSGYKPLIINAADDQLTSSSEYENHLPREVKLTGISWRPSTTDPDPWIEVDLLTNMRIEGVVTWGASLNDLYVNSYSIEHRSEGSDILVDYTDSNGDNMIFSGNDFHLDPTLNKLYGGIYARYVRLHVLGFGGFPKMRWELLGCTKFIHPFVDHLPGPRITSRDSSSTNCIKCTDTVNNQIRMQWKGLLTENNVINLELTGKSLICSHYFTTVGIDVDSMGSNTEYALCEIEGSGVDGTCHAACSLRDGQVGQPFNMLLMVTGDGAELCDVIGDVSSRLPSGRSIIPDWNEFIEELSAK
ncbi:hypothetical protein CAPTEDRAFT_209113 [Capitella teleta]|uniref:F5/8 type C domain-containing protein n=1 Tax=Capitella teleta TaxID=283909 RepID=R7UKV9_CAPTE|nr:hypothetical protein CAPTEDRAFT_209113 [Capitella teleta]|eukprot:ELU06738.1 hypothetical protein CAPTEDRAFT_209113 [Capitella teleta]